MLRVEERLKDNLTQELYDNFRLFLYVSKATSGPLAQQMYVFRKERDGDLALLYHWPVSTGRERVEYNSSGIRLPSYTPSGYYELDPHRFYRHHVSSQWGEAMPYAMFFNWTRDGNPTGLAIHAAVGRDIGRLGTRASAGCIRLPPEAARTLFTLIRTHYRGPAPRFAIDRRTGTMSNDGMVLHDAGGRPELTQGYKVLVFVQDYGGRNLIAAMY
ncbi:MAG TPA: L,D-transpeptidase [Rhizomicrobium sp.]